MDAAKHFAKLTDAALSQVLAMGARGSLDPVAYDAARREFIKRADAKRFSELSGL